MTDQAIENMRKFLVWKYGPIANFFTRDQLIAYRNTIQQQIDDIEYDDVYLTEFPEITNEQRDRLKDLNINTAREFLDNINNPKLYTISGFTQEKIIELIEIFENEFSED